MQIWLSVHRRGTKATRKDASCWTPAKRNQRRNKSTNVVQRKFLLDDEGIYLFISKFYTQL